MARAVFTAAAILLAVALAGAQNPPPQFRSSVQTVPIYATVADATGRLVPDLNQEDFEILDNGKPAPITVFNKEVQPISVVIAIDTSLSMALVLDAFVKDAAEAFILRMLPADRGQVANFDDKMQDSGPFSSDRDRLVRYIRTEMQFGNGTRLWDAVYQATARLKDETSRKVVLVLSDGDDTASKQVDGDATLARAQDEHVMVYVIGMHNRYRAGPEGPWMMSSPDPFLRKLTAQTGGGFFEISKATELNSTFTRVADELHRQYLIGISPSVLDGRLHKLDVRVKRPGMTARARKSYVASKTPARP